MFAQIVNFGNASINLKISVVGLGSKQVRSVGSTKTILTSSNLKDENSYKEPNKVHHHSLLFAWTPQPGDLLLDIGMRLKINNYSDKLTAQTVQT